MYSFDEIVEFAIQYYKDGLLKLTSDCASITCLHKGGIECDDCKLYEFGSYCAEILHKATEILIKEYPEDFI